MQDPSQRITRYLAVILQREETSDEQHGLKISGIIWSKTNLCSALHGHK